MYLLLFFVLGLIFGSFINALVFRLHHGETLMGRSYCPNCRKMIAWHDNIPLLSFLFLRGRCRSCAEAISFRYPLIELVTGIFFLTTGLFFFSPSEAGTWAETAGHLLIAVFLLSIAAYDLSYLEVPVLPIAIASIAVFSGIAVQSFGGEYLSFLPSLLSGLTGSLILSAFFFLLVYVSRETWMGWGDVWVGALVGLIVGWPGAIFLLTISSLLGSLIGALLIFSGKKERRSAVPFVPFLAAGTLITLCLQKAVPELFIFFIL